MYIDVSFPSIWVWLCFPIYVFPSKGLGFESSLLGFFYLFFHVQNMLKNVTSKDILIVLVLYLLWGMLLMYLVMQNSLKESM